MKPTLAILLIVCLTLTVACAFAADAVNATFYLPANNTTPLEDQKNVIGGEALGDSLYILTDKTLERWSSGDETPTIVLDKICNPDYLGDEEAAKQEKQGSLVLSRLFSTADTLYGLSRLDGKVWKLADASGPLAKPEAGVPLAWDTMLRKSSDSDYTYTPQMYDMAVVGDTVIVNVVDWNSDNQSYELITWSLSTGKLLNDFRDLPIRTFTPYRDGLILGKQFDDAKSWDEATQTAIMPTLVTVDLTTGKTETLLTFDSSDVCGVRYSAANDTLYYVQGSTVYSMPALAQPAKISAYLPNRIWENTSVSLLGGNMIATCDNNGVIVRGLDMPGIENGALTVYGEYGNSGHQAYLAAYPQALITCSENYYSSLEEFTNAMVAGTGAVDVLRLDSDYTPLDRLIEKGYALDLSAYPELMTAVSQMSPGLTSLCLKDGKLYGVPVDLNANCFGYNEKSWEALGLTQDDLPANAMEMLDFVANWQSDYAEDHPDLMLFDSGAVKNSLMDWILSNYMAYQSAQGGTVSFDTDLFHKLMAKMDAIDFDELEPDTEGADSDYWSNQPVFTIYANATYPSQYIYGTTCLPLPLDEGIDPAIPADVQVFIVNPRTTHLDQAIQYLSVYVQHLDPESSNITMFPSHNDPLENKYFDQNLTGWKDQLALDQKQLETAEPEVKANLQSEIDYLNDMITHSDKYRYTVSADSIAFYRAKIEPWLVVTGQSPLESWGKDGTNEFNTLEQQYMEGAISSDQFITEMDKRMRMMQLEDQ